MAARTARSTWTTLYALLCGVCGLVILTRPFVLRDTPTDLPALLMVTIVVLLVSYFRVPICSQRAKCPTGAEPALASLWSIELSLEGALLLGATLARGAAFGCWAAFIAGLVTPFVPRRLSPAPTSQARAGPQGWADHAIAGLLEGGRNVAGLALGWLAYRGLGGARPPGVVDAPLALALGVLFVAFSLIRGLWAWPVLILQGEPARRALEQLFAPGKLAVELFSLPVALLVSATLSRLGWADFFLLSLVFVGLGAVMRQMTRTIQSLRDRVALYELAEHVRREIDAGPRTVDALCVAARALCDEIVRADCFEIGLYNASRTQVALRSTTEGQDPLPPMTLPLTPLWEWLSTRGAPLLIQIDAQLESLPFALGPAGDGAAYSSAILVPLHSPVPLPGPDAEKAPDAIDCPLGAIAILSRAAHAFDERDVERVSTVGQAIGPALAAAQISPTPPRSRDRA